KLHDCRQGRAKRNTLRGANVRVGYTDRFDLDDLVVVVEDNVYAAARAALVHVSDECRRSGCGASAAAAANRARTGAAAHAGGSRLSLRTAAALRRAKDLVKTDWRNGEVRAAASGRACEAGVSTATASAAG